VSRGAAAVRDAYERVFAHREFAGRSGAMFAYEGLGSVYWHMVSKLLLAVQEAHAAAVAKRHEAAAGELTRVYFDVRAGLGFNKAPAAWGAFPTDPYSHTPGHAGAQQPGMTGQVKEGILARLGELGVVIERGCVRFAPRLLRAGEFLPAAREFAWMDATGRMQHATLPAGTLAFTLCGTLVLYTRSAEETIQVMLIHATRGACECPGAVVPADLSDAIFDRTGVVARICVRVGHSQLIAG
jgi:hypothetical protein